MPHQMLLGCSSQGGLIDRGMQHAWKRQKCVKIVCRRTWRGDTTRRSEAWM